MKATSISPNGTSFHDHIVVATVNQIRQICGEPMYESKDPDEKSQYDWCMETESGTVFTIYDWKEYRIFGEDEMIEWHIGAHSWEEAEAGYNELTDELYNL